MAEVTQTLSCRMPATLAAAVDERRRVLGNNSVSDYLKALIMADLTGPAQPSVEAPGTPLRLDPILSEIHYLREDVATLAVALLVVVGKQSQEAAEDWVRNHLSPVRP